MLFVTLFSLSLVTLFQNSSNVVPALKVEIRSIFSSRYSHRCIEMITMVQNEKHRDCSFAHHTGRFAYLNLAASTWSLNLRIEFFRQTYNNEKNPRA